jgi:hypothetical protein
VSTFESYAGRPVCCVMLSTPQAVLDVLRSLEKSAAADRALGLRTPERIRHLIRECELELEAVQARAASADGSAEVPPEPQLPESVPGDLVDVATAAQLLGVTPRQVRNLRELLEGRKVAGRWVFDRQALLIEVERRRERRQSA